MPAAKGLDHEAILRDRMAGMTRGRLGQKYGVAKSTMAWHCGETGTATAKHRRKRRPLSHFSPFCRCHTSGEWARGRSRRPTRRFFQRTATPKKSCTAQLDNKVGLKSIPSNGGAAAGVTCLTESLLDEHWRLLSVTEGSLFAQHLRLLVVAPPHREGDSMETSPSECIPRIRCRMWHRAASSRTATTTYAGRVTACGGLRP